MSLKRKAPLRRTLTKNTNARKPLARVAKRKVAVTRKANKARAEFRYQVGSCMVCLSPWLDDLHAHEIAGGPNRFAAIQERMTQLVLCSRHHAQLHRENWTLARQIALRLRALPDETGVRETVLRIKGWADTAVTEAEVEHELARLA